MNINATLLVQMAHFLIAYLILRHFLLRSIVDLVMHDRAYQKKLEDIIIQEEHVRVHKQEQQLKQWHSFQQAWLQRVPAVHYYEEKKYPGLDIRQVRIDPKKMHLYVTSAVQQIKERI